MKGGSEETFCKYEQAKRGIKEKWYFLLMENTTVSVSRVTYNFNFLKKEIFFIHLYMNSMYPFVSRFFDNTMIF